MREHESSIPVHLGSMQFIYITFSDRFEGMRQRKGRNTSQDLVPLLPHQHNHNVVHQTSSLDHVFSCMASEDA